MKLTVSGFCNLLVFKILAFLAFLVVFWGLFKLPPSPSKSIKGSIIAWRTAGGARGIPPCPRDTPPCLAPSLGTDKCWPFLGDRQVLPLPKFPSGLSGWLCESAHRIRCRVAVPPRWRVSRRESRVWRLATALGLENGGAICSTHQVYRVHVLVPN